MSITAAARAGRRELLEALRDKIAGELDAGVGAREMASLTLRLLDISAELDGVIAAEEGDGIAEAAATPDETWSPS